MEDQTKPLVEEPKKKEETDGTIEVANVCPTCNGDGLVLNPFNVHERCSQCLGKGKLN